MKIKSLKINNKKIGHIIHVDYVVMCPICFVNKSGIAILKVKGVRIGIPVLTKEDIPAIFYRHYPSYVSVELNVSELARVCNISRTKVYRYIKVLQ